MADAGQTAESCVQAERVIALRRALYETEPDDLRLQQELSEALKILAVRLEEAGHSEQTLRIMVEVASSNPSLEQSDEA